MEQGLCFSPTSLSGVACLAWVPWISLSCWRERQERLLTCLLIPLNNNKRVMSSSRWLSVGGCLPARVCFPVIDRLPAGCCLLRRARGTGELRGETHIWGGFPNRAVWALSSVSDVLIKHEELGAGLTVLWGNETRTVDYPDSSQQPPIQEISPAAVYKRE